MVLPKDISTFVPGYLSLHSSSFTTSTGATLSGIALKWTPNQLMNGNTIEDKSVSWQYALNLELRFVQFIHCHQVKKVIQFDFIRYLCKFKKLGPGLNKGSDKYTLVV